MADRHDITTADDVPLAKLLDITRRQVDRFNDAERDFLNLFVETTSQRDFEELPNDQEVAWTKLASGEHPETIDIGEGQHIVMRSHKYGQALHFTQERIRKENSDRLQRRVSTMLDGYVRKQQDDIFDTLMTGISDGTQAKAPWYTVDDFGEYTFSQTHSHKFDGTQGLFSSEGLDHPYDSTAAQPAHRHISVAADHFRHHNRNGPYICLIGQKFARRVKDEMDLDVQTYLPEARNLRAQSIRDLDIQIDNVRLVQSPWFMGDEFLITQAENGSPVKLYEEYPIRFTGPTGAPVRSPGDLIGAYGHANYGLKMVDPLGALHFTGDGTVSIA